MFSMGLPKDLIMMRKKRFLCVIPGEKTLLFHEIAVSKRVYAHVATSHQWIMPGDDSNLDEAAGSLRSFLKEARIHSFRAVIGVPAKWTVSMNKFIPDIDSDAAVRLLLLESERDFSVNPHELMLDYTAGGDCAEKGRKVFLAGVSRKKTENLIRILQKAGIKTVSAVPVVLAIADNNKGAENFVLLHLGAEYAEMAVYAGGYPLQVKHLAYFSKKDGEDFSPALRRISSSFNRALMLVREGLPDEFSFFVADGCGLSSEEKDLLVSGMPFVKESISFLSSSMGEISSRVVKYAMVQDRRINRINFVSSALYVRKKPEMKKTVMRAAAAAGFLAVVAGAAVTDLRIREREISLMRAGLERDFPWLESARNSVEYFQAAEKWRGEPMKFLECVRELTLLFPPEGRIWVTNMALREDMRGLISGRAVNSGAVLEVIEKMNDGGRFSDVRLLYIRNAGGGSDEVVYSAGFVFKLELKDGGDKK